MNKNSRIVPELDHSFQEEWDSPEEKAEKAKLAKYMREEHRPSSIAEMLVFYVAYQARQMSFSQQETVMLLNDPLTGYGLDMSPRKIRRIVDEVWIVAGFLERGTF